MPDTRKEQTYKGWTMTPRRGQRWYCRAPEGHPLLMRGWGEFHLKGSLKAAKEAVDRRMKNYE